MEPKVFTSAHWTDADGDPEGGTTFGQGFAIGWQHGPLGRGETRKKPNGAFVEHVIEACIDRLDCYQGSRFACDANRVAIEHLKAAVAALKARTADREARQVEGTLHE